MTRLSHVSETFTCADALISQEQKMPTSKVKCHLLVSGDQEVINKIIRKHFDESTKTMDFSSIVPMPEAIKESRQTPDRANGEWLMDNDILAQNHILRLASEKNIPLMCAAHKMTHGDFLALALDVDPEMVFEGLDAARCREYYGASSWYDWSKENWGTKWNASNGDYEITKSDDDLCELHAGFLTACTPATPVLGALAEMYPEVTITHHFLAQDGGEAGTEMYAKGRLISRSEHDWSWFAVSHFGYEFPDTE
jgi:hypothetical protein